MPPLTVAFCATLTLLLLQQPRLLRCRTPSASTADRPRSNLWAWVWSITSNRSGSPFYHHDIGDLVSLFKVIQSDKDGEASWSSMTITHLVRLHHYHGEDYCFCHYFYYYYYTLALFFLRFPPNFTGMDPRWTLLHWPSLSDLDLLFKVTDPF